MGDLSSELFRQVVVSSFGKLLFVASLLFPIAAALGFFGLFGRKRKRELSEGKGEDDHG